MAENGDSLELVETRDAMDLVPRWEIQGWWFFAAALFIAGLVVLAVFIRRKKIVSDPLRDRREAYHHAKDELSKVSGNGSREDAVKVSLALRGYLAKSTGDPALFETHEEFIGRDGGLAGLSEETAKDMTSFFTRLARLKYGSGEVLPPISIDIATEGRALLDRMYEA